MQHTSYAGVFFLLLLNVLREVFLHVVLFGGFLRVMHFGELLIHVTQYFGGTVWLDTRAALYKKFELFFSFLDKPATENGIQYFKDLLTLLHATAPIPP